MINPSWRIRASTTWLRWLVDELHAAHAPLPVAGDVSALTYAGVNDLGGTTDGTPTGPDRFGMVGGDFVNRFDIAGRSYKVIPQIERVGRLNPEQLQDLYVSGPDGRYTL